MVRAVQPVPAGGLEAEEEMKSKRIQRKRTRGWRMPRGAVYVGRPSKFSNPYAIYFENGKWFIRGVSSKGNYSKNEMRKVAVLVFEQNIAPTFTRDELKPLRGKNLVCWCPLDQPCHADVLLELANK